MSKDLLVTAPSIHINTAKVRKAVCALCPNLDKENFACSLDKQSINLKVFLNNCPENKWPFEEYQDFEVLKNKEPSLAKKAKTFSRSMYRWAISGFLRASKKQYEERLQICKGCEFWDKKAWGGTGKCKKCGCSTYAKLKLKTETCPIGKW